LFGVKRFSVPLVSKRLNQELVKDPRNLVLIREFGKLKCLGKLDNLEVQNYLLKFKENNCFFMQNGKILNADEIDPSKVFEVRGRIVGGCPAKRKQRSKRNEPTRTANSFVVIQPKSFSPPNSIRAAFETYSRIKFRFDI
jgi:hypothetical protein